jgi:SAM-dependent methyltransferase
MNDVREAVWPGGMPEGIDPTKPSTARVYDVHLGGTHNFEADRRVAAEVAARMPELPALLRANRDFLRRAVQYLVDAGVRQFLDIGSGIPTVGNVHDIAQHANPDCKVVYVDIDPVAVAHSRAILAGNPWATAVNGDLTAPKAILHDREIRDLLDLSQPIALLMVAVLHFQPDIDHCVALIKDYTDALAPDSYLVISHATAGEGAPDRVRDAAGVFSANIGGFYLRDRDQVARLFGDLTFVEPGLVNVTEWRPDVRGPAPALHPAWAGVARVTGR